MRSAPLTESERAVVRALIAAIVREPPENSCATDEGTDVSSRRASS